MSDAVTVEEELEEALDSLTATALARICGILGLSKGGSKPERVERLLASSYPEATVLDFARKALFTEEVAHLASSWFYGKELNEQGLPASGNKEDRIWRLIENNLFDPRAALGQIRLDKLREVYHGIYGQVSLLSREGTSQAILSAYGLDEGFPEDLEADEEMGGGENVALIFVSHSHRDYGSVREIKEWLERFGTNAFVAHKDIEPTSDWREKILTNLENCDLFLAFLTKDYKDSAWTDQEFGIARARGKPVLPVVVENERRIMPYGFMEEYQAFVWGSEKPDASLRKLVRTVLDQLSIPTEEFVRSFESFEESTTLAFGLWLILERSDLEVEQVNRIAKALIDKPKARDSALGNSGMSRFYHAYEGEMDSELRDKLGSLPEGPPRTRRTL